MTVLIATKNRPAKLLRCLKSIPAGIAVAIHGTCQTDICNASLELFRHKRTPLGFTWGDENIVEAFNLLAHHTPGDVLPVPDDVEFTPGFFAAVQLAMSQHPQALVFGMNVTNREHNDDAVTCVRREFITSRGFLFDPRFKHFFIDYEIGRAAKLAKTFHFCKDAQLSHYHPEVSGEYDHTHSHRRKEKWLHDKAVWDQLRGIAPAPV